MPTTVRFVSSEQASVPTQRVYLKARWADEWTEVTQLWCQECTWSMAPTLSTAQVVYRYGEALEIGAAAWSRRFGLTRLRFYVKIEWDCLASDAHDQASLLRTWIGVIDEELDEQFGPTIVAGNDSATAYPKGRNHFMAFGLESLLAMAWLDRSAIAGQQGDSFVRRPLTFNAALAEYVIEPTSVTLEGNRSPDRGGQDAYVFHGSRTGGEKWSTRTAVEYALAYDTPRDHNDEQIVPFALNDADNALPAWDEPILNREGLSCWDELNALMSRQRGLAWRVQVVPSEQDGGPDIVQVIPCSFLADLIFLADQNFLPANPHQKVISWENDRGADPVVRRAAVAAEQIIVQGERRTSTATFSYEDGTLEIGWPSALETEYEQGASLAGDYPAAAEVEARQWANKFCRSADRFRPVFARHLLASGFDGMVGDGTSGTADKVLCPSDADPDTPEPLAPEDLRFWPQLALLAGFAYDGDAIDSGNPTDFGSLPNRHLEPLVLFPRPNLDDADTTERYYHIDTAGIDAEAAGAWKNKLDWSGHVRVDDRDGSLWVSVDKGQNHWLAATDFTPLDEDKPDENILGVQPADYREMLATLTVPWSAFAEARYPEDAPVGYDTVRQLVIRAPYHRLDYVVPDTVVGLDAATGELLRTDSGGFIRDDRDKLKQIAQIAFGWYGQVRKMVSFSTSLVNNALELGDLILAIGDPDLEGVTHVEDVNSVITQIRIVAPLAEGPGTPTPVPPRIAYETGFGELDPLALIPRGGQH